MASLCQIPVLNFSVCKKGKQKDVTCTLDCNNPKMPLHTKGLYLYKSSENVYNKFNCTPPPPTPQSQPSRTVVTSLVREGIKCRRAILWPPQLRTLAG